MTQVEEKKLFKFESSAVIGLGIAGAYQEFGG
jgi:hypothetical protein